jgi:ribosomal protein S18 acetylase RimI-like enzyme
LAGETAASLRLILGTHEESHLSEFLIFARDRRINLESLWVAENGGSLLWALLPVLSPGRTMLLFSSAQPSSKLQERAAGLLVEEVCARFAEQGMQLAQALLDPKERTARSIFEARGFHALAQLDYLHVLVRRRLPAPLTPPGLAWETYSPASHARFAATILATYESSLDCPALNGLRDVEDIIAGHQATGEFDPSLWFLLSEASEPRGVLLLNPTPRSDSVELVYLGLAAAGRGRGLGDLLMKRGLSEVSQRGRSQLTLAVDAANPPALKLYYRHGLHRLCSKVAMMRKLGGE